MLIGSKLKRNFGFKKGVFVNILTADPREWELSFRQLEDFPALDHIEIWVEYLPTTEHRKILKSLTKGIEVILHGPFIHTSIATHLNALLDLSKRRFSECLDFATTIDAKVVTFHAGSYPVFRTREQAFEAIATHFAPFSRSHGPVVTLENMPVKYTGTLREPLGKLSDLAELRRLIPDVRFTLDVGHCVQNEDDFAPFLEKYRSSIYDIHLHDARPRGRGHMRLGDGVLDLPRFLITLLSVGFDGYVSLETITREDTMSSWDTLLTAERNVLIRA